MRGRGPGVSRSTVTTDPTSDSLAIWCRTATQPLASGTRRRGGLQCAVPREVTFDRPGCRLDRSERVLPTALGCGSSSFASRPTIASSLLETEQTATTGIGGTPNRHGPMLHRPGLSRVQNSSPTRVEPWMSLEARDATQSGWHSGAGMSRSRISQTLPLSSRSSGQSHFMSNSRHH